MNTKTRSIPSVPFLAFLLSLLCAVSAPAATSIVWTARSVAVNTNGVVTSPTNFWGANSNAIIAITGTGGGAGATNAVTVDTNGVVSSPTNFWSANAGQFPTGTNSVTVDTNGVVTSPTNFWVANSNDIAAIMGGGTNSGTGVVIGTANQITVTTAGPTNTLSLPTNVIVPTLLTVGKTNTGFGVDVFGAINVDGSPVPGQGFGDINVAAHKITAQSGTDGFPSTNAVDGSLSTYSQSLGGVAEWWKVDLGQPFLVGKIILTKTSTYKDRPPSFSIQYSTNWGFSNVVTVVTVTNTTDQILTLTNFTPFLAQYIMVHEAAGDNTWVRLAEFGVYEAGGSSFSLESTFNGPVALARLNGSVRIGSLSGVLSANNGVITATTGSLSNSITGNAATSTTSSNLTGILPVANGGTGNTTNRAATAVLASFVSGPLTNNAATSTIASNLAGVLPLASGGTGTTNGLGCTNDILVSSGTTNRMIWSGGILLSNIPNFHE